MDGNAQGIDNHFFSRMKPFLSIFHIPVLPAIAPYIALDRCSRRDPSSPILAAGMTAIGLA